MGRPDSAVWARLAASALGIWLMAAPWVLGYLPPARHNDSIVGPLIVSFAFVAVWEVTRGLRWLTVPLGLWLLVAPWILGAPPAATINEMLVGAAVAALAFVPHPRKERYGGGWTTLLPGRSATGGE